MVNEKLNNWARPIGINDITSFPSDYLKAPLVNQPGTRFEYGISIDWAGILVMRVSGLSLDDYFRKFIFDPLEIKKLSFFPDSCMKKNLAYMHHREHDGTYRVIDQPLHQQLIAETPDEIKATFNAGGAGCFAQPSEYCSRRLPSNIARESNHSHGYRNHRDASQRWNMSHDKSTNFEARNRRRYVHPSWTAARVLVVSQLN